MSISSKGSLPGLIANQRHEDLVQRWFGLIEAVQADSTGEAGLQDRLRVGMLPQLEIPANDSIGFHRARFFFQPVKRTNLGQLPQWLNIVLGLKANAARKQPFGLRDSAVENLLPLSKEQDAVAEALGVLHDVSGEKYRSFALRH